MALSDFDFELPDSLIARRPLGDRDASRLLVLGRDSGRVSHRAFKDLPALLLPGDLLVLNDARVFPARLVGKKDPTGGRAELLLVEPADGAETARALEEPLAAHPWVCLGQASKGLAEGARIAFDGLRARIEGALGEGEYRVRFEGEGAGAGRLTDALARAGQLPLPPYLERAPEPEDAARYQTVFAASAGASAAPTAGLHFTPEVFRALDERGVEVARLTLDVGPGTFLPVRGDVESHRMHEERFRIPEAAARAVARARREGRRVVAVGTTVVRTLEAATRDDGELTAGEGRTRLFIRPGFAFRQVDVLLTNFHLPRSTLLMLVSAFAGREHTLAAYREAVAQAYRFFSYGDAMLIMKETP